MYPGFLFHWQRAGACRHRGADARGGESAHASGHGHWHHRGPGFGVRRPLRVMTHELDLDTEQVEALARLIDDMKTERAQAAVHERRSVGLVADALTGDEFDRQAAEQALNLRVQAAEQLRDAVLRVLEQSHSLLRPEQRKKLAYLLRSGIITI